MNEPRQESEPCGIRLMRLMETRLLDIIRQEHSNRNCIHLYGTGEYWTAFEQSAYLLCRIFPGNAISVITHTAYHPLAELSQCILDSSNGSIINVI